MKSTLELQQLVAQLGIDPARYLAWKEQELLRDASMKTLQCESTEHIAYEMI